MGFAAESFAVPRTLEVEEGRSVRPDFASAAVVVAFVGRALSAAAARVVAIHTRWVEEQSLVVAVAVGVVLVGFARKAFGPSDRRTMGLLLVGHCFAAEAVAVVEEREEEPVPVPVPVPIAVEEQVEEQELAARVPIVVKALPKILSEAQVVQ